MPQKPYAFLDLDNTLIDTEANYLNEALIKSLLDQGIKDLCLFTSMNAQQIALDLQSSVKYSRPEIVKELENRGFTVHAVITPIDIHYKKPGQYYNEDWIPHYNIAKNNHLNLSDPEEYNKFIYTVDKKEKDLEIDLKETEKALNDPNIQEVKRQSLEQKRQSLEQQLVTHKGVLFSLVMNNKNQFPNMGEIIYFEDSEKEIENVKKFNQGNNQIPLTIIPVHLKEGLIPGDVPNKRTIRDYESRKEEITQRYTNALPLHIKERSKNIGVALLSLQEVISDKKFWKSFTHFKQMPRSMDKISRVLNNNNYDNEEKFEKIFKIMHEKTQSNYTARNDHVTTLYQSFINLSNTPINEQSIHQFKKEIRPIQQAQQDYEKLAKEQQTKRQEVLNDTFNVKFFGNKDESQVHQKMKDLFSRFESARNNYETNKYKGEDGKQIMQKAMQVMQADFLKLYDYYQNEKKELNKLSLKELQKVPYARKNEIHMNTDILEKYGKKYGLFILDLKDVEHLIKVKEEPQKTNKKDMPNLKEQPNINAPEPLAPPPEKVGRLSMEKGKEPMIEIKGATNKLTEALESLKSIKEQPDKNAPEFLAPPPEKVGRLSMEKGKESMIGIKGATNKLNEALESLKSSIKDQPNKNAPEEPGEDLHKPPRPGGR